MLTPPSLPPERVVVPPDQKTLDAVLKNLRTLCAGNGVRGEDVVFDDHKAEIFTFGARSYVRLVCHHTLRTHPGAYAGGENCASLDALNRTLAERANALRLDGTSRALVLKLLDSRPDKGFAVRDEKFFITELAKEYTAQENCRPCSAKGTSNCESCAGKGQQKCMTCHGRKFENCPVCRGTRQTIVAGKPEPCRSCQSRGQIPCRTCRGMGTVACSLCRGMGAVTCRACNGAKIISHIATTQIEAHLHFDYDRDGMTTAAVKMMDGKGADFAKDSVRFESLAQPEIPPQEPPAIITRDYSAQIAAGKVMARIKGRKLTVEFAGFDGRLVDAPPFLDILTRPGQQALKNASLGQGDVAALLIKAGRYKMVRDILQIAAKYGTKPKALQILTTRYPVGIDAKRLKILLHQSDKSFAHITKKPRIIWGFVGFLMGAVASFFAAPFVAQNFPAASDVVLYGFVGVVTLSCGLVGAKAGAALSVKRLQNLLHPKTPMRPTKPV